MYVCMYVVLILVAQPAAQMLGKSTLPVCMHVCVYVCSIDSCSASSSSNVGEVDSTWATFLYIIKIQKKYSWVVTRLSGTVFCKICTWCIRVMRCIWHLGVWVPNYTQYLQMVRIFTFHNPCFCFWTSYSVEWFWSVRTTANEDTWPSHTEKHWRSGLY